MTSTSLVQLPKTVTLDEAIEIIWERVFAGEFTSPETTGLAAPRTSTCVRGGAASQLGETASPRTYRSTRELVVAILGRGHDSPFSFCVFCGSPCYGRACRAHADLTVLEQEGWAA